MQRSVPNRSLVETSKNENRVTKNFCPIQPKTQVKKPGGESDVHSEVHSEEMQSLLNEYKFVVARLREIRGILYKRGINPEQFK